jgi:hypothetical protein
VDERQLCFAIAVADGELPVRAYEQAGFKGRNAFRILDRGPIVVLINALRSVKPDTRARLLQALQQRSTEQEGSTAA